MYPLKSLLNHPFINNWIFFVNITFLRRKSNKMKGHKIQQFYLIFRFTTKETVAKIQVKTIYNIRWNCDMHWINKTWLVFRGFSNFVTWFLLNSLRNTQSLYISMAITVGYEKYKYVVACLSYCRRKLGGTDSILKISVEKYSDFFQCTH